MAQTMTNGAVGSDAWSREADRVRILAAQAGRTLDEGEIQLMDVYDLQALRQELQRAYRRQGTLWALLRQLPVFGGAMIRKTACRGPPAQGWRWPSPSSDQEAGRSRTCTIEEDSTL